MLGGSVTSLDLSGITKIGFGVFSGFSSLTQITGTDNLVKVGQNAFANTFVTKETTPCKLQYLDNVLINMTGDYGATAVNFYIKEGTVAIADSAFSGSMSVLSITIPKSVKYIGSYAFSRISAYNNSGDEKYTTINYKGTSEEWLAIEKGYGFDYQITWYCVVCSDKTLYYNRIA